jgi:hypothetical protein
MAGNASVIHGWRAASSRWKARRTGCCGEAQSAQETAHARHVQHHAEELLDQVAHQGQRPSCAPEAHLLRVRPDDDPEQPRALLRVERPRPACACPARQC